MQVFLSKQCLSLTGCLGQGFGYYLRSTNKGNFYAQRSRFNVPPTGHLRFIFVCAELAQNKLHITDIRVSRVELKEALYEARCFIAMQNLKLELYNARDILNLKTTFGL